MDVSSDSIVAVGDESEPCGMSGNAPNHLHCGAKVQGGGRCSFLHRDPPTPAEGLLSLELTDKGGASRDGFVVNV